MFNPVDSRELQLFIENDSRLYQSRTLSIIRSLAHKKLMGIYDADKALRLWVGLARDGAKAYGKQYSLGERDGLRMFNVSCRAEVAARLAESYQEHIDELAAHGMTIKEEATKQ